LTAIVFPPGGNGRKIGEQIKKGQLYTEGDTMYKTIQKHRIHKIENKQNKNTKIKKNNKTRK